VSNQKRFALLGSGIGKVDKSDVLADGDFLVYNATTTKWETKQLSAITAFVEAAQDAVGAMLVDSSEIDFTYTDATPALTATLINASIAYARIANASALSVLGRSANSSGVLADIAAGSDFQVLRRSGTVIGFGAIDLSQSAAVTGDLPFANIAQLAGFSVAGRSVTGTGDIAAITAGTDDRVLRQTASALNFGQLTAGMFPALVVPDAALSANVPLLNASNIFLGVVQRISGTSAAIQFEETDQAADEKVWRFVASSGSFAIGTLNDSFGGGANALAVTRSGTTILSLSLSATTLSLSATTLSFTGSVTTPGSSASEVGYQGNPINQPSTNYQILATDQGKTIYATGTCTQVTNIANATAPVGFSYEVVANGGGSCTLVQGTGNTMYLENTSFATTGDRTVPVGSKAYILKLSNGTWLVGGSGVT
jgi:hypothetical protein